MSNTLIDLIIPMDLDTYTDLMNAYEETRKYWADKGQPNFQLCDFLYLGGRTYRDTHFKGYALEEFNEFQNDIAFIKKDSLETTGIEIETSDIIMLAVGTLANKIREVNQAEPDPFLDNTETT